MKHKLIAIKKHLHNNNRRIILIPPDQIPKIPNQTSGIEFSAKKVTTENIVS